LKRRLLPPLFFSVRLPTLLAMFWRAHIRPPSISGIARKGPLSILIVRLDSLGDVVMTTPLFRALKSAFPKSRCTVVVQRSYKSLLATNPHIDEILTLPNIRPGWLPARLRRLLAAVLFFWTELRKQHFDFAIAPRWDVDEHLATFLCLLSDAATHVGYSETATATKQRINRGFDRAYNVCLPPGPVRHEVLRNLDIAEALGASVGEAGPEIYVTEQDRKRAAKLLRRAPAEAKLVAIGIGARSPGRRWPLKCYCEIMGQLDRSYRAWPVIVCSGPELGEALKLARSLRCPATIVSGARLRDVCAVLERCELFIGNDSGCAHLAAAMGCKTVVISRHPRNGDPDHGNSPFRFAPFGRQVRVLQPASGLERCTVACSSPRPHCITQVKVEEVVAAARELLTEPQAVTAPIVAPESLEASQQVLQVGPADALPCASEALHSITAVPVVTPCPR